MYNMAKSITVLDQNLNVVKWVIRELGYEIIHEEQVDEYQIRLTLVASLGRKT